MPASVSPSRPNAMSNTTTRLLVGGAGVAVLLFVVAGLLFLRNSTQAAQQAAHLQSTLQQVTVNADGTQQAIALLGTTQHEGTSQASTQQAASARGTAIVLTIELQPPLFVRQTSSAGTQTYYASQTASAMPSRTPMPQITPMPAQNIVTAAPAQVQAGLTPTMCFFNWAYPVDEAGTAALKSALDAANIAYTTAQMVAYGEDYVCDSVKQYFVMMDRSPVISFTLPANQVPDDAARGAIIREVLDALETFDLDKLRNLEIRINEAIWRLSYAEALALTGQGAVLWQAGSQP